jgi:protocatechuate 3,4-dioxygenase, alpha subunit
MSELGLTPSQTVGPYFSFGLTEPWEDREDAVAPDHADAIEVFGHVLDGRGEPLPDAMIETWQADPHGRFDHPDDPRGAQPFEGFRGFGRSGTDDEGRWRVRTLKPGRVPAADGETLQAPHLLVTVMARGMLQRLVTRIYFCDEGPANAEDRVLGSLPADARETLIAQPVDGRGYRFDIHLQGDDETAFFAL